VTYEQIPFMLGDRSVAGTGNGSGVFLGKCETVRELCGQGVYHEHGQVRHLRRGYDERRAQALHGVFDGAKPVPSLSRHPFGRSTDRATGCRTGHES